MQTKNKLSPGVDETFLSDAFDPKLIERPIEILFHQIIKISRKFINNSKSYSYLNQAPYYH